MQKNESRKGLALGAVFALVASIFVGMAPAQANENTVVAYPASGTAAQTTVPITEQFDIALRFGTGVVSNYTANTSENAADFGLKIEKSAGVTLSVKLGDQAAAARSSATESAATSYTVGIPSSASNKAIAISLSQKTSVSAAVSITVTPFMDLDKDGLADAGEPMGTAMTITYVPWSSFGTAITLTQPNADDHGVSASFAVTAGSMNWSMLDHDFAIALNSTKDVGTTWSEPISGLNMAGTSLSTSGTTNAANYTASFTTPTATLTSSATPSVSATIYYNSVSIAVTTVAVQGVQAAGISFSTVLGANAYDNNKARFNSALTVRAFAYSSSVTTSVAVARTITVSGISNMEFDADSGVTVNGTSYTSSAAFLASGFTLAAGTTTFAFASFGQSDTTGTDSVTFTATNGLVSQTLAVTLEAVSLTPTYVPTSVAGLAGASKTFALTVADQFGETPVRTDLRIAASVTLGGSASTTVSAAVASGKASVTVTPIPATRTGSAVVVFTLQKFDQDIQDWTALATDSATWNVYSYAAGTNTITSRTVSISASISYGVDLSWSSNVIAVGVTNSFSDVTVTAPGLMIQNSDEVTQTASDTLTIAANGKTANFKFTSRLAGTYTVTITNGTDTTTSKVVVNPARSADGAAISLDTTTIAASSTKVITGTLRDANGNPVNTSGSATILVTYNPTGNAGIPIGTMPTETDVDGEFTILVLTGANDAGTAVVSVTYYKDGASGTAAADVLTLTQAVTVGGTAAGVVAADKKVNAGSFKGYVAVYAKGYAGQRLSAKVGNDWMVVESLASNFERVVEFTGAGYTIAVRIYIDRVLVDTITVTTK